MSNWIIPHEYQNRQCFAISTPLSRKIRDKVMEPFPLTHRHHLHRHRALSPQSPLAGDAVMNHRPIRTSPRLRSTVLKFAQALAPRVRVRPWLYISPSPPDIYFSTFFNSHLEGCDAGGILYIRSYTLRSDLRKPFDHSLLLKRQTIKPQTHIIINMSRRQTLRIDRKHHWRMGMNNRSSNIKHRMRIML